MPRPVTIRTSLTRDLALLVMVLGAAVFGATFVGARSVVRSLSESLMDQMIDRVEAELDTFFDEARVQLDVARRQAERGAFDLPSVSRSPALGSDDFNALREHRNNVLRPVLEAMPQVSSLMIASSDGREHMLLRVGDRWRNRCSSADETAEVRWLEWDDGSAPTERTEGLGYDARSRRWFVGAQHRDPGNVHWTDPYAFFTTGAPGITASSAYDGGDGLTRVLAFDVLLSDISEFTRSLEIRDRGLAAVLTDDRRLIGLPGLGLFDDDAARKDAYLKLPEDLGLSLITDAVEARGRLAPGEAATFRFVSDGEVWWGRSEPYALAADAQLRVAILVPETDLLGDLLSLRLTIIAIVLGVLGIGVLRAAAVAKRFSAPVEELVARSERITRGDLEPGEPIESSISEIRKLVCAQEHMREGILARLRLEKVERDLDLAREIQQGLLPSSAIESEVFEIAGWNKAADQTGGDFYDWAVLPTGEIALTLADVTGHGVGPALIVAVYRAYLRSTTTREDANLDEVLGLVNDLLYADIPDDRFITAVIGLLNPMNASMRMISAGHGPLLYYHASTGKIESWDADTVPLGIMSGIDPGAGRRFTFERGDMLMLVTDGFFEWANPDGGMYGTKRLADFVCEHQHLGADDLIAALYQDVLRHANGTEQADDLTAVVIRRRPGGAE